MAYLLLGKLYYSNQSEYAQTYKMRFESDDTIKLNFFIAQKQAFFVQNTEVLKLAYEIVKLDKSVSSLSAALPGIAKEQYSKKCLIDEIVLTNKIEGVHSSRKEIDEALEILEKQAFEKGKHLHFIGLANKYLKLMTKEKISLDKCQDIRDIYDELFLEEVIAENPQHAPDGKIFRKEITTIHSETDKIIHRGLYPESEIITAIENALAFLNDSTVDFLYRACIFHYLIEYIHPFYDGNGRLGRFILSYCLSEILEPLLSYRISETIKENINTYYKAFQICNDPHNLGDLTPFLLMLLNMIYDALNELNDSLTRKRIRWDKYEKLVSSFPEISNSDTRKMYSYLIQAALFSEKGISTAELKMSFNDSYYTVRKILEQIKPELLISKMHGKSKYYQINLSVLDSMLLDNEMDRINFKNF
jgi:Fic family protein